MVAKFISKTHYKTHFSFFELFCPRLSSKFAKSANMIKKIYFKKCNMGIKKTQNLKLISNPLEKLQIDSCEKSYQRKSDRKMEFLTFLLCAKVFGL